jgi:hypothetical protein
MSSREIIERADGLHSYKLSKMVADLRGVRGSYKAVLRAMADRYPNIWMSVRSLAEEAGFGETETRNALRLWEHLQIVNARGDKRGGRGNTEQYLFDVERLQELTSEDIQDAIEAQREALALSRSRRKNPLHSAAFLDTNPTHSVGLTQRTPLPFSVKPTHSALKPTHAVGEQRSNKEACINREREQRSENRSHSSQDQNQNPKPSGKENKRLACIRDWAWGANPKAVFTVTDDQELAGAFDALDALQRQYGKGLDKFVKQAVCNRSAAMNPKESEIAGHLIAVNLPSDVRSLLASSGKPETTSEQATLQAV